MNLSNGLRWVSFCIYSCFLWVACTHAKDEPQPVLRIVSPKILCVEGDSVSVKLLADNRQVLAGSWSTTLGTIDDIGRWIAPTHTEADTVPVSIVAAYQNQQTTIQLHITKRASQQPAVSYTQTIQPLLVANCNFKGCHANGSRAGKIELSGYDSVRTSVIPYNAPASKLYYSLIKTDPLRIMPPAGKLHADKIQSVWLWIEQGALNN